MTNFDTAREALETSLDSSGSAMAEHEKWQQSLEAQINNLKAAWQGLSQTFLNSSFLKNGISLLTKLVSIIEKLVKTFGTLGTIGLGTGLYNLFKTEGIFGSLATFGKWVANIATSTDTLGTKFKNLGRAAKTTGKEISSGMSSLSKAGTIIGLVVAAIGLAVNAYKKAREEASAARQETIEASNEYLKSASSFEQAYIKYSGKTNLTVEEEQELESAIKGTVDALGDKSSALQNVVNASNDYVASLERITKAELKAADTAAKKKKQAAKEELKWTTIGEIIDGSEVDVELANSGAILLAQEIMGKKLEGGYTKTAGRNTRFSNTSQIISLDTDASEDDILDYYYKLLALQEKMLDPDVNMGDTAEYERITAAINKMKDAIATYENGIYDAAKAQYQLSNGIPKTVEEYLKMRETILRSDDVKNLSFDAKNSIANALDSEYKQIFDLSSAEVQARKFIGLIKGYGNGTKDGTNEIGTVETFLNMRTAVNNNECTVGEYLAQFDEIDKMTENWSDEEKELLNTSFGLDTDGVKAQYEEMQQYLQRNIPNLVDKSMGGDNYWIVKEAEEEIEEFLSSLTSDELAAVVDIRTEIDWENASAEDIRKQIEDRVKLNDALNFETNIEIDTTALEVLNKVLEESASAMGLSEESIDSLKSKYADLEGYNPHTLFEKTANGVKVNREELAKLEKKYNDLTKTEVQEHLDTLVEEYNKCTKAIDGNIGVTEKLELINKRDKYAQQIEELAEYQAQLEGVTGAYQKWLDAQNGSEDYEGYESIATGREDIEEEIERGFISNKGKAYIDLLSGKDLQGGTIDDYANAWEKLDNKVTGAGHSINDFFTVNDDGDITATGIDRFFKSVQKDFEGSVATFDKETQKWQYNFSQENLKAIQDEWGIGIEAIELLLEAAASAGYDVDWGGIFDDLDLDTSNFESLVSVAEAAQKELNKLEGYEDLEFNFSTTTVEAATSELEKAQKTYNELVTGDDGKININAKGADQARIILATLLVQKQQLEDSKIAINISTSGLDDAQAKAVAWVQDFRTKYKNLEIAISTGEGIEEAKTELETVKTSLDGLDDSTAEIAAKLVLGEDTDTDGAGFKSQVRDAISSVGKQDINVGFKLDETAISDLNSNLLSNFTVDATAKITNVDKSQLETVETGGMVNWTENTDGVSKSFEADGTVYWNDNIKSLETSFTANGTVTWTSGNNVKVKVISEANGTANANGTAGRAFARGNWGIKGSGVALGGELGQELVVRDGKFFTIGDTGAEFFHYKPNDIIFNAAQTESLFKYGGIKGAKPRGTMYADGSAFAEGGTPSNGKAFAWSATSTSSKFAKNRLQQVTADGDKGKSRKSSTKTQTKTKDNSVTTEVKTTWNANASDSNFSNTRSESSTGTGDKEKKEFEEVFDWIETAISRIEREIDNLDRTANSVYKSWGKRNEALAEQISKVGEEIKLQNDAAQKYLDKAGEFLDHNSDYAKKIQKGALDFDTLNQDNSSEELIEKIKNYQKWYELYLDCTDAVEEFKETEAELYAQRFENVQSEYENLLQGFDHTETMLNEYISQAEAKGHIVSKNYYDALIDNEEDRINTLKQEQSALIKARDEAVANDEFDKYSEEWYSMCQEIDSVTQAIEEGTTSLIEYNNAIRDIEWEVFDLIQERISDITDEADFLIELMSNKDLFDDNGKFTAQGVATMALHGQNYNTYMYQADEYGKEAAEIDKQLAKDPYDQELINRRRELIELQREMILNAEGEKNAVRDLVEEGINLELEALDERIQKYEEALEAQKDLYDYQKRVEEQTKEISSLQKQLSAYEGDNSEEAKAKIQELRVSLEEAESDLEETQYDKYISDQSALLDNLYTEYELLLNERLDNTDALMQQVIDGINAAATLSTEHNTSLLAALGDEGSLAKALGVEGAIASAIVNAVGENGSIKNILNKEVTAVGATLSSKMGEIWTTEGTGTNSVLAMYGKGFQDKQTTTNTALSSIRSDVAAMVDDIDKDAQKKAEQPKTKPSTVANPTNGSRGTLLNKDESSGGDGKPKVGDKVKFVSGQYYYDSQGTKPLGSVNLGKEVYITQISTAKWSTHPYHIARDKNGKHPLGWLKLNQLSGYAAGKKNLLDSEYAWTQENGQEYIVRPSDGAILTPVAKGDSVLTSTATNNIWNMANSPAEFIKDNLNLGSTNVPNNSTVQNSITQNLENVTFSFPNVHSYEEMLAAMQKDKNFERLITSMSIDRLAGKSSLAKGKAIR